MMDSQAKTALAGEYFRQGYNCAQAVVAAFAAEAGLKESEALLLSSGLGGGLGGLGQTCGAVSGMVLVYGRLRGYDDPEDPRSKADTYAGVKRLMLQFDDAFGSWLCKELKPKTYAAAAAGKEGYCPRRPCCRYVEACAGLLADALNDEDL